MPPVCRPMSTTFSRPWLRSMISWAMRQVARCMSSADMTRVRATKTPPYGGVRRRSRSATRMSFLSVWVSQNPLHGQEVTIAAGRPPPPRTSVTSQPKRRALPRLAWDSAPFPGSGGGADLGGDGGEHAVDEAAAVVGGVPLGQLDGLGDHRAGGHVGPVHQLEGGQAQQGPVERRACGRCPSCGRGPR